MDRKLDINTKLRDSGKCENIYSKRYMKLRTKFRRYHKKIRMIRKNWIWNICKYIVTCYKRIVVDRYTMPETYEYEQLPKQARKNIYRKSVFHGMYTLNECLEYMANKYGCEYIKSPKGTTCTCSNCHTENPRLHIRQRKFKCYNCGFTIDRDINAAINCYAYAYTV